MKKLNLGCGCFKRNDSVNVDVNKLVNPDILMDLNKVSNYRKHFKNNEFDVIFLSHVLEHLDDPFEIMKELHRILVSGGKLFIKVPHFSRGFSHAQHKAGFDVSFPFYFNNNFKGGFYGVEFKIIKMRLNWMVCFDLKKGITNLFLISLLKILNHFISFLANLNVYFCSRFWCYLVGGFEEIEFVFKKD